jgi:Zn-dependent protease with chaperone function
MGRLAAESILHGLIAAPAVVAILAAGGIRSAKTRLRFWLLAIACPVAFTPLIAALAPARLDDAFRDQWSLLSGSHFAFLRWRETKLSTLGAFALAAIGSLLYLRDLLPFLLDLVRSRKRGQPLAAVPDALARSVSMAAAALRTTEPKLHVLASPYPILICRGWRKPHIVTSTGLLASLSTDELDAAIAHEVAHARRRDPAFGWVLMLVRGLFLFNPFVQLCARATAHEIECRADDDAAATSGGPEPVVRSLRKLAGGRRADAPDQGPRLLHGFRLAAVEARCRSLLDARRARPTPRWALPATALGLGVILFFTVA